MANNEEITLHVSENSPYVIGARAYVEQTENGAVITIIDKEGTTTATVSNGKGIASATLNEDYTLTLIYTDGTSVTTTSIRGEQGESGVYCGSEEPDNPDVDVWIDPTGDPYPMEDEIADAVDEWITAHPEYVTTVQDGAITVPKFAAGVVDTALNKVGYPAESKATGDAIAADRTRLTAVEGEADALDARITNLAQLTDGSTTGDAELMDARVVGSTTYSTLHEAIDTEFTNVKSALNKGDLVLETRNNFFSGFTIAGRIDNTTGADATGNYLRSDYVPIDSDYTTIYARRSGTGITPRAFWYDSTKTFISQSLIWAPGNTAVTATLTPPSNAKYFRSYKGNSATDELCLSYEYLNSFVSYVGDAYYIKDKSVAFDALADDIASKFEKYAVLSNCSVNDVVELGRYQISTNVTDKPSNVPAYLEVVVSAENKEWLQQYFIQTANGTEIWFRNGRNQSGVYTNFGAGLSVTWGTWTKVLTSENTGQTVVCLGDSIFGLERGTTSIPSLLASLSGAKVYNCALGGTRAGGRAGSSSTITKWRKFDFVALTNAIVAGDYSEQVASLDATGVPDYFAPLFNTTLPSIDFSKVDVVIINYGGNDYTGGNEIGSISGTIDADTYLGGLYTGITNLLTAFPNLRFLLVSPPYKYFLTDGAWSSDSDIRTYNTHNDTLGDFAKSLNDLHDVLHSPLCDLYNGLGINKYNYPIWFISGDGSHPNADGRLMTAKLVNKYLGAM